MQQLDKTYIREVEKYKASSLGALIIDIGWLKSSGQPNPPKVIDMVQTQ